MKRTKWAKIIGFMVVLLSICLLVMPMKFFIDNYTTNYDKTLLLGGHSIGIDSGNSNNNSSNVQTNGIVAAGTLTYIDPSNNNFGAFGHKNSSSSNDFGYVYNTNVISSIKGNNNVGYKIVEGKTDEVIGEYNKNTDAGIFGSYYKNMDYTTIEVGNPKEIKLGKAYIATTLYGNNIEYFEVKITFINYFNDKDNILFTVTDKDLLERTGGIIHGMSGSPIIQNNKLIGAVSSVNTNDFEKGYGIFATNMLKEQI